jgi:hypothetical protein
MPKTAAMAWEGPPTLQCMSPLTTLMSVAGCKVPPHLCAQDSEWAGISLCTPTYLHYGCAASVLHARGEAAFLYGCSTAVHVPPAAKLPLLRVPQLSHARSSAHKAFNSKHPTAVTGVYCTCAGGKGRAQVLPTATLRKQELNRSPPAPPALLPPAHHLCRFSPLILCRPDCHQQARNHVTGEKATIQGR